MSCNAINVSTVTKNCMHEDSVMQRNNGVRSEGFRNVREALVGHLGITGSRVSENWDQPSTTVAFCLRVAKHLLGSGFKNETLNIAECIIHLYIVFIFDLQN